MDPYTPPSARVGEPVPRDPYRHRMSMPRDQGRPGLVWVTQILLGLFILSFAWVAVTQIALSTAPALQGTAVQVWMAIWMGAWIGMFGTLLYGLAVRRRWAWHWSIVFATFLLLTAIWGLWARVHAAAIYGNPAAQGGAMFGSIFWAALLLIYPFRLFFSQKVRRFLSVDRTDTA